MPADYLLGRVSLDSFGADIPTDNPAIGIHEVDRIFPDAFDQDAEAFFAAAERFVDIVGRCRLVGGNGRSPGLTDAG
ncbi:MAG: hypothetical protein ACREL5_00930 [Gemmatimonadales bacterium]